MKDVLVVFSHGKESGPWGLKIRALARVAKDLGAQVTSVDYRKDTDGVLLDSNAFGEADRRVRQLLAMPLPEHRALVLMGSSMGAYVSTIASYHLPVNGLFLLAPAFYLPGYSEQDPVPHAKHTLIVHGWKDEVVPAHNSIRFAQLHKCDLHLLDGDHRLNDALFKIEPLFELFLRQVTAESATATSSRPARPPVAP